MRIPIEGTTPATLRGEQKVLREALEQREQRAWLDMEMEGEPASNARDAMEEEEGYGLVFTPGTFIELRRNEQVFQGLVLGENILDRIWHVYTLKPNGEVIVHNRTDVQFAIPGFVSADLAERCGMVLISRSPIELNARIEALKRLREITLEGEQAANRSNTATRQRNINIYDQVKHPNPRKWGKTSLAEVTKLLYTDPSYLEYFGTHKYCMHHSLRYVADENYFRTQSFSVRPLDDIVEIETVERWLMWHREKGTGPYRDFAKKARTLLQAYDKNRTKDDSGPMSQAPAKHKWTEHDKVILGYMLRSLQPYRSTQANPYVLGRSSLIKHLMPEAPVSDSVVHDILVKLGVMAPWQDLVALLPEYDLDLEPKGTSARAKAENALIEKGFTTSGPIAGGVLGPEDFHPSDPLESVRHDFGDARVFIIDDVGAEELDDGVSIERIPSEPDNHWVHVHVADPASLLHPGHALSHQARERFSTMYLTTNSYPMLPKSLMHHPTRGLSLGMNSKDGIPDKVITFSTKVDDQANILDYKVRAGLIRNVKKVPYNDVDHALGNPQVEKAYPFGGQVPVKFGAALAKKDVADLQLLQRLAHDQVAKRYRMGVFSFNTEVVEIDRITIPPQIRSPTMTPSVFSGFPELRYSVFSSKNEDKGARNLVAEMMKLACRTASRFGLDKNIPLLRRGTEPIVPASEEAYQDMLTQRTSTTYIDMTKNLSRIYMSPPAEYSLEPKQHHPLGIPAGEGYTRATSPLRRYEDLVAHWQLHHALLGSNAPSRLPFDAGALEKYCQELVLKDRKIRKGQKRNTTFFALMFLRRWLEGTAGGAARPFGDPLASTVGFTTTGVKRDPHTRMYGCSVHLPELGVLGHLGGLEREHVDIPLSTELRVKVTQIDLGIQRPRMIVELV
ncbi:hypothetical protein B0H34DRAFT_665725 [Crassisporium funariophilum]|nr:hypothetical protein B0H34DRAFT_665725 [Crassisporium funariophilum]